MVCQAYQNVRANKGSAGIDAMSWEYLDKHAKTELYKLWNRLSSGCYFPRPVIYDDLFLFAEKTGKVTA